MAKKEKVIVYGETERAARRHYSPKEGQTVGYRVASEFSKPETADVVLFAGDFPDIKKAYSTPSKKN